MRREWNRTKWRAAWASWCAAAAYVFSAARQVVSVANNHESRRGNTPAKATSTWWPAARRVLAMFSRRAPLSLIHLC